MPATSSSGYGYGFTVYGDQTLAAKLNTAGTPVNLIIGGHSHTNLSAAQTVGTTKVVQAHYNGRKVGRADITVNTSGVVSVNWTRLTVCALNNTSSACLGGPTLEDAATKTLITTYSSDPDYQALINTEIGWTNVPIVRDYNGDSLMGYFINDAVYNDLNNDAEPVNDVDMFFNNPGGVQELAERFGRYGRRFQVGQAPNRSKWGAWTRGEYLALYLDAAEILRRTGAVELMGPAVIDLEFYSTLALVHRRLPGLRYDILSSLLYVDRRGAPENRQLGLDTVDKVVLLRAIAEVGRASSERCWITEMNCPLREGPHSPAGRSVSVRTRTARRTSSCAMTCSPWAPVSWSGSTGGSWWRGAWRA